MNRTSFLILMVFLVDTLIKQQLSSLMFVKSTCETRSQRIKEGLDENDAAVSMVKTNFQDQLIGEHKKRIFMKKILLK